MPGTFKMISDWGITYLEDGNDGTYGYTMEEYKGMIAENNLEMVSVSAPFEELENSPDTVLKRAQEYGAKYVVCFWIPHSGTNFTLNDADAAITVFNKAGKLLEENGVLLAYHPHGDELLMHHIIKKSEYCDFEMDIYWFALPGENPVAWLRKYPDEFKLMHAKDCEKGVPVSHTGESDVENMVVLGTVHVDVAAAVQEARKMGMEYIFLEDESSRVVEQAPENISFLKGLK